ncbi:tetratricopeptide repeat protein [Chloracidobacterium thermophilum]|uniref:tetratricopeptide repeat protein n=1 Tax=Chloracidobacterium thermophilum TaxID=458033 RepID=UPI0007388F1C|nr:tetratricopeptide repeat protein [Chloracidobacterium thermophilum]
MTGTDRPTAHQKKAPVWVVFLWGLLIGVLGWYSFERTLTHDYVIDDVGIVERNPNAAATASLPALFQKHYWQDTFSTERGHRNFHYRPLTIASYVLVARSLGNGPVPQHLVNVALHIIVSWLMLWVVYAWLQDTLVAGLAGVVFVTHPLHTEVIAMIVGRAELLAALGALSALGLAVAALKLPPERSVWQHWLLAGGAALCLFAGWLAKESSVLFFPLWLLIGWACVPGTGWQRLGALAKRGWRTGIACTVSTAFFWYLHQRIQSGVQIVPIDFAMNPLAYAGRWERWATGLVLLAKYLVMHLWPFPLQVDYSFDSIPLVTTWRDVRLWSATGVLAAAGSLLVVSYRRRSPAWVGLAFLLGSAALFSHFIRPFGFVFAERVMYLPSVGYALAAAVGFRALWNGTASRPWARWLAAGAIALLIGQSAWQTRQESVFYRDSLTAVARSLATGNQRSVWLWQAYGTELLNAGRLDEAVAALERAHAILPLAETCAILAKAHLALGNSDAAREAAQEAVTRDPTWMPYRELFGVILFEVGQLDAAATQFEAALTLVPEDAKLHAQLAVIRQRQGQTSQAIRHYELALRFQPDEPRWWAALGRLHLAAGNPERARFCYRQALEGHPDPALRDAVEQQLKDLDAQRPTFSSPLPH